MVLVSFQFLALAINLAQSAEPTGAAIEGKWRNPSGSVIIAIAPCGEALCGRVQWASEKAMSDARRGGTDPLVGAELLSDVTRKHDDRWKARLFVPDINKTSKVELRPLGPDQLKVMGCALGGIVCKSQIWTRAGED